MKVRVSECDDGVRLDVFLARESGLTRSAVKTALEKTGASVNGVMRFKSGAELKAGDEVEFVPPEPEPLKAEANDIPLDIVYEDENYAVVNKPRGMVVHQAASYRASDTLVNALLFRLKDLSSINGVIRPGIVHRLDKDTTGLLVVAKNDDAHRTLQEQIARHRPNDTVKLSVKRDGDVKQIEVTLRNKAGKTELMTKEDVDVVEALGGKFADAGTKLCRELEIKGGVQVVGIKADGILARARVKQGFVITHINDRPVYSFSDMQRMTEKVRSIDGVYPNGRSASYMLVE